MTNQNRKNKSITNSRIGKKIHKSTIQDSDRSKPRNKIIGLPHISIFLAVLFFSIMLYRSCSTSNQFDVLSKAVLNKFNETEIELETGYTKKEIIEIANKAKNESKSHFVKAQATFILGHDDRALKHLEEAIAFDPKNEMALLFKGAHLSDQKKYNLAVIEFNTLLKVNPISVLGRYALVDVYFKMENYDLAHENYLKTIELDNKFEKAHIGVGLIHQQNKDFYKSNESFETALEIKPNNLLALHNLGNNYIDLKDYDRSIVYLRKALEIDHNAITSNSLGLAYKLNKDYDNSIIELSKAIELDSTLMPAFLNRANSFEAKGLTEDAERDFTKAIQLDSTNPLHFYERGHFYLSMDSLYDAFKDFSLALRVDSFYHDAIVNRAVILKRMGNNIDAIKEFTRAININPSSKYAIFNRAASYYEIGKFKEAKKDFNLVFKIDPNFIEAREMYEKCFAKLK